MKPVWSLLVGLVLLVPVSTYTQSIIISEVLINPSNANQQFVEIYNRSSAAVNISGWRITNDAPGANEFLHVFASGTNLGPDEFLTVVRSATAYGQAFPGSGATCQSVEVTTNNAALRTAGDQVFLRNGQGNNVNSVSWSNGISRLYYNGTSYVATTATDADPCESIVPLPVELIHFNAESKDRKARLSWSTATEENNSHFLVQRSRDGLRYATIGKVNGRGTSDFQNDYAFTDERPMSGLNYYRLQQVDYDGTSEYSPVVTATLRGMGTAVAPTVEVQEAVTLTLEQSLAAEGRVRILDASGRILSELALAPGQDQYQIPTGHLSTGVHFLHIEADGETTQQRMVK